MKEPMLFVNAWRFLNIIFFMHLWLISGAETNAFILILSILVITLLRWRFHMPIWSVIFDFIIISIFLPYAEVAYFILALPIFELALKDRTLLSFLFLILPFAAPIPSSLLFWYFLLAIFFGTFSYITLNNQDAARKDADRLRKQTYDLERVRTELLAAGQSASHQAELMERNRISRELHDHLGHDLTGTLIAFNAFASIDDDEESARLKQEIKRRLERSTQNLRETVHNMTTTTLIGVEQLDAIIENFQQYEIDYYKSGDTMHVPAYKWHFLTAYLKEVLTNVSRHSNATKIEVDLMVADTFLRLSVHDNGTDGEKKMVGSGLRNLQMRARSMGGSLSIARDKGYLLVCVIPLGKEGTVDESANRR